jgi:hypothetical protein
MAKRNEIVLWVLIIVLFAGGSFVGTAIAQKKTPDAPKQNSLALGEDEVKQLLLLMDTDKNGKISKKEFIGVHGRGVQQIGHGQKRRTGRQGIDPIPGAGKPAGGGQVGS